jgi:hypothetical protein
MKATFRLFVTLLLLIGWGLAASALHVVWTGDSPLIIPKERLGVTDTYVDISNWTPDDVGNHPMVVKRIVAVGKTDRLAHVFKDADSKTELLDQIQEALDRGPTTKQVSVVAKAEAMVEKAKGAIAH